MSYVKNKDGSETWHGSAGEEVEFWKKRALKAEARSAASETGPAGIIGDMTEENRARRGALVNRRG